jgi:hypothetical protein
MLHPVQKQHYKKRFAAIESSFRVEGMDPSGDTIYEAAKAGILSGELTPKQALSSVVQRSAKSQKSRSKDALVSA